MGLPQSRDALREELVALVEAMHDELYDWRATHPAASLDEIAAQVTPRRRQLVGKLIARLACLDGDGTALEGLACPHCGQPMVYKGAPARTCAHLEGDIPLKRAYYHCPACQMGFFPLDHQLQLNDHNWTPDTIQQALLVATEIPFGRAAQVFERLSRVPLSRSSLQRLVQEYGGQLVDLQAEEAEATVKPPAQFDEASFRQAPDPDSEVMTVSMDGAFINIRGEGWKEVKTVTVSAVEANDQAAPDEPRVRLTKHSYRSGLWEAKTFAWQQWAEAVQRGIEKATIIVSVNDGGLWIWAIVAMCYAPCIEILDWWHALQRLWQIANVLFGEGSELGKAWVAQHKAFLWAGNLRPLFHYLHTRYPHGASQPDGVHQALGYFFANRHRIHYQQFRQAGYPVGSGAVEAACKTVVAARLKQAGMRWSRTGAQALLALRSTVLSDRWDDVWPTVAARSKAA